MCLFISGLCYACPLRFLGLLLIWSWFVLALFLGGLRGLVAAGPGLFLVCDSFTLGLF